MHDVSDIHDVNRVTIFCMSLVFEIAKTQSRKKEFSLNSKSYPDNYIAYLNNNNVLFLSAGLASPRNHLNFYRNFLVSKGDYSTIYPKTYSNTFILPASTAQAVVLEIFCTC